MHTYTYCTPTFPQPCSEGSGREQSLGDFLPWKLRMEGILEPDTVLWALQCILALRPYRSYHQNSHNAAGTGKRGQFEDPLILSNLKYLQVLILLVWLFLVKMQCVFSIGRGSGDVGQLPHSIKAPQRRIKQRRLRAVISSIPTIHGKTKASTLV